MGNLEVIQRTVDGYFNATELSRIMERTNFPQTKIEEILLKMDNIRN